MKLVNIVLAIYKPNTKYLEKLLYSLNGQTYPNIKIIIRDDSHDNEIFLELHNKIKSIITNFDYIIYQNSENFGSNKTFELLTQDADGDYIAYCDQDDIWEKDKISKLVETLENENAVICYSDLSIIDGDDILVASSFKDIHKRLKHVYGENLFEYFIRRNSITGCTMIIKACIAKEALPFCSNYFVHDHWLTLFGSTKGKIAFVEEPLIKYRIHENNQIGASMLSGINSREDYLTIKLLKEKEKCDFIYEKYHFSNNEKQIITKVSKWTQLRINFFRNRNIKNLLLMIKYMKEDPQLVLFEMIINLIPIYFSNKLIGKVKK